MEPQLPLHLNLADVPWEVDDRPGRYACDEQLVGMHVRQRRLDLEVYRLQPGKASWPFHFHHVDEELFFVLSGTGELRLGPERRRLRPNDVVSCPPGPDGAHQFYNDGTEPLVYLAISSVHEADVVEYPDSGKLMTTVGELRHIARKADAVPYMDGE